MARSTALSIPRLSAIGLAPAATVLTPSRKIAWARTVAVVVPSPATSEVFEATSRTICAPMFSNESFNSISFATVTPSLVIVGEPNFLSSTTLRPLGPSVIFTASASWLTPRRIAARDSSPCMTCLAIVLSSPLINLQTAIKRKSGRSLLRLLAAFLPVRVRARALDDAENLVLAHDEQLLAVDLDLGAAVLAEEHAVTRFRSEERRVGKEW